MSHKLKQKAVIIIGGSEQQIPQINWAKSFGFSVVVTDKNPNVPGKEIADRFEVIDGTDIPKFLELAKKLEEKFDLVGMHSNNDFALLTIATLSEFSKFKNCPKKSVINALDKSKAKEIWKKEKLFIPEGKSVENYEDVQSASNEFGLPVIIKPVDSSGSQGVRSVWNNDELKIAFDEAKQISKSVLIEKFIEGIHIDINGLFLEGNFIRCGSFAKYYGDPPYHNPIWGHQPALISPDNEDATYELVEKAARTLGIDIGPVKADLILTKKGPCILELAPRFHGDVGTTTTTSISTVGNPIKAWFSFLAGNENPLQFIKSEKKLVGWRAIHAYGKEGIIESITGIEDLLNDNRINDVYVWKKTGDRISFPKDTTSRVGFIWATAKSLKELDTILTNASSMIKIKVK